jgi:hypothetical protein
VHDEVTPETSAARHLGNERPRAGMSNRFRALTRVGARIDPISQSVKVTGAIGGHFPELTAGMSGRVLLTPP